MVQGGTCSLGLNKLERIEVPVPPHDKQLWFDAVQTAVADLHGLQGETVADLDALLPSLLDQVFKGEYE